jgi:hypothetical protein
MIGENSLDSKKLVNVHRSNFRQLQKGQRIRQEKRDKRWSDILGKDVTAAKKFGSGASSSQRSQSESQTMSRSEADQGQQQNLSSLLGGAEVKDENMFAGIENETHAKEQVSLFL